MRALIVDDEAPARSRIRRLLDAFDDVEIVGEAATGHEAVALIKRAAPDLVFLDIQMPGLDGFEVAARIDRNDGPFIVFVTADESHALRAFDVGAVDYLLKPFTPDRFSRVIERARERTVPPPDGAQDADRAPLRRLLVIENGRATFLLVDRIDRIEADRNYVVLFVGADRHRLRGTLAALSGRLDPAKFLQINRSTVVRLDAIREMTEWSHGDFRVVMHDGTELLWSRRFRAPAERTFGIRD